MPRQKRARQTPATFSADPTMDTLAKLRDPAQWRVVENVPIFKCFSQTVLVDGKALPMTVTDSDLYAICSNYQKRMDETATVGRVTIGHIKPHADEKSQPEIIGHPLNFRVGGFGPSNELAILCDLYIRPDCFEEFKKYPYRSPEYYPERREITGVAVLIRDPKLDLGMLTFSGRPGCFYFALDAEPRTERPSTFDAGVPPLDPTQPPMAEPETSTETVSDHDVMPDELKGHVPDEFHGHFVKAMRHYAPKMFASFGFPSGTNLNLPARDGATHMAEDKTPLVPAESEALRMMREQNATQFARQEELIKSLQTQLVNEQALRQRSDLERQLVQFENENPGIRFDRSYEMELMAPMNAEQRGKHLQYMRDNHTRDMGVALTHPVHQSFVPVAESPRMFARGEDADEMAIADLALQFQRENPVLDWEECMQKAREKRTPQRQAA